MTHPIYTRQQLQFLSLKELRTIASQLGIEPADKRSKDKPAAILGIIV